MQIDLNNIKKILIIQYKPFGDVLLNTAYLPFLREKFPNAQIDFLVRKPYQVVLEGNPYIDEIISFVHRDGWRYFFDRGRLEYQLYRRKYDLVIDQIRNSGSALLTFFSRAKYRIGWDNIRWRSFYNIRVPRKDDRYYASMKFDLLKPLGIKEKSDKLFYHIKPESVDYINQWFSEQRLAETKLICFSPGSPIKRKKWNLDHYAKSADLILENTDRKVLMLWGPREKDDVDTIASRMTHVPIIAPPTDFNQAAAMLQKCELLICNDGGINHLAVAVKTPSLAIFSYTNPTKWCATELGRHFYPFLTFY